MPFPPGSVPGYRDPSPAALPGFVAGDLLGGWLELSPGATQRRAISFEGFLGSNLLFFLSFCQVFIPLCLITLKRAQNRPFFFFFLLLSRIMQQFEKLVFCKTAERGSELFPCWKGQSSGLA